MSYTPITKSVPVKLVERVLFNVRWVLPLFYLGLVAVLVMYGVAYAKELWQVGQEWQTIRMDQAKVFALDFVDVVMIANLVKMIVTGSYNSFITKTHGYAGENITSGMLKVKIASSVVVVMMIHLLKQFVTEVVDLETMAAPLAMFGSVAGVMVLLAGIEYVHIKGEVLQQSLHKEH